VEAFAVPIKPGKEETWKSWAAEISGARKAEFDDMNERMGLTTHAAWLQQNPDGSQLAVVVLDGPGAPEFLGKLAVSNHGFDTEFRRVQRTSIRWTSRHLRRRRRCASSRRHAGPTATRGCGGRGRPLI
jgi:hypothetical protein